MDQEVGTYNVCCIIPARMSSSRFPGKPLAKIKGRELILRVCDIAAKSKLINKIIVATEDKEIYDIVISHGYENTRLTTAEAHSGVTSLMFDLPFDRDVHDAFIGAKRVPLDNTVKPGDVVRMSVWIKRSALPLVCGR